MNARRTLWTAIVGFGVGLLACGDDASGRCDFFDPSAQVTGTLAVEYRGALGELDFGAMMLVHNEAERVVRLTGCTTVDGDDVQVDVAVTLPKDVSLPAPFGSTDRDPRVSVWLYRYDSEASEVRSGAEFADGPMVEVSGSLKEFEQQQAESLELDATLSRPCAINCQTRSRSQVHVHGRLTWDADRPTP